MSEGQLQRVFGENLRRERITRRLSQEAFAEVLGFHRTYMGSLERGERNLSLDNIHALADALGVTAAELIGTD